MVKALGFGARNSGMIILALLISSCLTWASYLISPNLCYFYFILFVRNNEVGHP